MVTDLFEQVIVANNVLMSFDTFRDTLKAMDEAYPKEEDGTAQSYTKLGNKQFLAHLEWMRLWAGENGITFTHDEREWERLMQQARG